MTSSLGYMELCRLCLVKDKVTVPIFGDTNDVRQIFLKITACLPVKVSRDDNLPKKICDTCLYKIDLLYQFWNTTINAEKQLIQWLNEIGVDAKNVDASLQMLPQSHAHPHAMQEEIMLKEERIESETKDGATGFPNMYTEYPYQNPENNFDTPPVVEETTTAKRKTRGRPAGKKKAKVVIPESEDEDSIGSDRLGNDDTNDSDSDGGKIAKQEADSDEDYVDNPESLEPTTFVDVPSAADAERPGPSGLSKPATITAGTSDQGAKFHLTPTGAYKCEHCAKIIPTRARFARHLRRHTGRKHTCLTCAKTFCFESELLKHQTLHMSPTLGFNCSVCNKLFKTEHTLRLHTRRHEGNYTYHCKECQRGFVYTSEYKYHVNVFHGRQRHKCPVCPKEYASLSFYKHHVRSHSENFKAKEDLELKCPNCPKTFDDKYKFAKHKTTHVVQNYVCQICGKTLTSRNGFYDHLKCHSDEKPHVCEHCHKGFKRPYELTIHLRNHTQEKPYGCKYCGRRFPRRGALVLHERLHSGERPFSCDICQKAYTSKSGVQSHRDHKHGTKINKELKKSENVTQKCSKCDLTFLSRGGLNSHIKIKHDNIYYTCEICGRGLASKISLKDHMMVHSGEKPYSCDLCSKTFNKLFLLNTHRRVHTGEKPFSCKICCKKFTQQSSLIIHMRYHTGERPYKCEICQDNFITKTVMKAHIRSKHGAIN